MTSPRGLRNCNPGNIRHGEPWLGLEPNATDPDFCQFVEMKFGIRALLKLLQTYRTKHHLTTVRKVISRWAPASENDTDAYVTAVAHALSVGPDDELGDGVASYVALARAIALHENGPKADEISAHDWAEGASLAFNVEQVSAAPPPPVPPIQSIHDIVTGKAPTMPAPFLAVAFEALSTLLPTLIRLKSKGPQGEVNAQIAEKVVPIVQAAVGATNAQEAVEKVANDPAAFQAADKAVREKYLELVEVGGGVEAARDFALEMTSTGPEWRQIAYGALIAVLATGVVLGGGFVMWQFLMLQDTDAQMSAQILDYFKAAGFIVLGWVFGSSARQARNGS